MTSNNIIHKTAIAGFAAIAIAAGSLVNIGHSYAKESGEKGGTEDINIGVGELQECTISKSMDSATPKLAQYAINGNPALAHDRLGNFEIQHATSDLQ